MKSKVADLTWFCSLQFQTPFRCCCCCLLQTTLSCQVTNTSIDFRNKYINSVVSLVASGAQILSNNCKHLYDYILKHSEYHHSETTPVYLTVVRVRRMVLRLYNLQSWETETMRCWFPCLPSLLCYCPMQVPCIWYSSVYSFGRKPLFYGSIKGQFPPKKLWRRSTDFGLLLLSAFI